MSVQFDIPASEAILRATDEDVELTRPFFTGDVFSDLAVAGMPNDNPVLCALIAHPCSMRQGAVLSPRLLAARVLRQPDLNFDTCRTGALGTFPLPDLGSELPGGPYAIKLDDLGVIASSDLPAANRVACLSDEGIVALQQKLIFNLTRAIIAAPTIHSAMAVQLEEADLLEDWNISLLATDSGDVGSDLLRLAEDFDAFLGSPSDPSSLRRQLQDPQSRASVRRAVYAERNRRLSEM